MAYISSNFYFFYFFILGEFKPFCTIIYWVSGGVACVNNVKICKV